MITVTLEEHEARALAFSSDMGDAFMERLAIRSPFPRGLSPREIAVLKLISALEQQEKEPSRFEAPGVEGNPHLQHTWDPRSC